MRFKKSRRHDRAAGALSFIGPGTTVVGDVIASSPLRIDGRVQGAIKAKEEVTVGESGLVEGPIQGVNVVIAGEVSGDVSVTGNLRVLPGGRLIGDAYTANLIIDEGAIFRGKCEMTMESKPQETVKKPGDQGSRPESGRAAKQTPAAPS